MIPVEICINSKNTASVRKAVAVSFLGGASTIELCAGMRYGGLTPEARHIREARAAFPDRPGLMVMVRPREGGFSYSQRNFDVMLRQIRNASESGADGVAFGVLRSDDNRIDTEQLQKLVEQSKKFELKTTFHRAFDATPDTGETLDILIDAGIDRVLTCGISWGKIGSALDGVDNIAETIRRAKGQIEVVVCGGVSNSNVTEILSQVPLDIGKVSVHAYSGAQVDGTTRQETVKELVESSRLFG